MTGFEPGDIVKVPFPSAGGPVRRYRPALVVSSRELQERHGLLWVLMITSANNPHLPGDVEISDLELAGLPAPSVVRCAKVATMEAKKAVVIGKLALTQWNLVSSMLGLVLSESPAPARRDRPGA